LTRGSFTSVFRFMPHASSVGRLRRTAASFRREGGGNGYSPCRDIERVERVEEVERAKWGESANGTDGPPSPPARVAVRHRPGRSGSSSRSRPRRPSRSRRPPPDRTSLPTAASNRVPTPLRERTAA